MVHAKPHRLVFLTGEYPPMRGGIADYTALLAEHLRPQSIDPAVLISQKYSQTLSESASDSTLAALRRPGPPVFWQNVPVYSAVSGWGRRCWGQIKQFLQQHPTDVLHIQYQAAAFDLGGWVNWLPRAMRSWPNRPAVVVTFHDLRIPYLFPKAGFLRRQTVLALARYSDAVICTNPEDAFTLRRHNWATHITEIPLGNNVPVQPPADFDRQQWRLRWGFKPDSVVLAYFGFLNHSKGGEDLIAVLDALVKQGIDARLLMIGGDVGDSDPGNAVYARRVRAMIAERNLAERIVFTGYVDLPEVSAFMLAADVAVMPYRDGVSFRRTTLLAVLRHGLPVITTTPAVDLPSITEGDNMLLVSPGDVAGLTAAVIRVVNDRELKQRLSEGARQLSDRFAWPEIAAKTAEVYKLVMGKMEK